MRKFFLLFVFLLIGCSSKNYLTCSYTDLNNIYGEENYIDNFKFKNDALIYFERIQTVSFYSDSSKNMNAVYKIKKMEGKLFKRIVPNSKYKVYKDNGVVSLKLFLKVNSNTDLSNILIDTKLGYDGMYDRYSDYGYLCK